MLWISVAQRIANENEQAGVSVVNRHVQVECCRSHVPVCAGWLPSFQRLSVSGASDRGHLVRGDCLRVPLC